MCGGVIRHRSRKREGEEKGQGSERDPETFIEGTSIDEKINRDTKAYKE